MTTQTAIWNDLVGDAWVRHDEIHCEQAQPFGDAVLDAIGLFDGATVLDVGCGTGPTTLAVAARGAREVLGIDLSTPMIERARTRLNGNHSGKVTFDVGDVLALETSGHFDAIVSRFGVMFFDDPVAAFVHVRGLARPGGRLGFCSWGEPAANPWMIVPVMASVAVLGPPELAGPGEPGPFSLATPGRVREVLAAAGWSDVTIDELALERPFPARGAEAAARVITELSPPIASGLARSPELAADARAAVADALRPLERDGRVYLGASALIVTAVA